jgi:hypothetical protein
MLGSMLTKGRIMTAAMTKDSFEPVYLLLIQPCRGSILFHQFISRSFGARNA